MSDKRLHYIDILKGIGIILVILGHSCISGKVYVYIFSFHMPLFFFISGYLYINNNNFMNFVYKKIKTLLIPYICFAVITGIIYSLISNNFDLLFLLEKILYLKGEVLQLDSPLWFLPCLFFAEIIYYIVYKFADKDDKKIITALILLSLVGYFSKVILPFGIQIAFTGVVFMGLGNLFKKYELKIKISKYLLLGLFIIGGAISLKNGVINMYRLTYNNYIMFYVGALISIFICFEVAKFIKTNNVLEYLGRNSLIFMATHIFVTKFMYELFKTYINSNQNFVITSILGAIFTIIAIVVSIPFVHLINNHIPFMIGKNTKRK